MLKQVKYNHECIHIANNIIYFFIYLAYILLLKLDSMQ